MCVSTFASNALGQAKEKTAPITPKSGVIRLFNGKDLEGLYTFLEDTKYEDPRKIFSVHDGLLAISGDGYGGVVTRQAYRDYHLVCEFKWGKRTWLARERRARDSGILVHGNGPDGSYLARWLTSFEAQIIQGGLGDLLVVNGVDDKHNPMPISLSAEVTTDRDGEIVWRKGGQQQTFHTGRINWYGRDPDWKDVLDFRGASDIPGPNNGWTRMEVICSGNGIRIMVNGVLVNEASGANPSSGKITLQTEAAEIFVRRWELWPLDATPTDKSQ